MKTPRYTDADRWPNGYRRAAETDISKTFARVRAEQKRQAEQDAKNAAEAQEKMRPLKKARA